MKRLNVYYLLGGLVFLYFLVFQTGCQDELTNRPPDKPVNPYPPDEATDVVLNLWLTWEGSDPDDDRLTYYVYFGTMINSEEEETDNGIAEKWCYMNNPDNCDE